MAEFTRDRCLRRLGCFLATFTTWGGARRRLRHPLRRPAVKSPTSHTHAPAAASEGPESACHMDDEAGINVVVIGEILRINRDTPAGR